MNKKVWYLALLWYIPWSHGKAWCWQPGRKVSHGHEVVFKDCVNVGTLWRLILVKKKKGCQAQTVQLTYFFQSRRLHFYKNMHFKQETFVVSQKMDVFFNRQIVNNSFVVLTRRYWKNTFAISQKIQVPNSQFTCSSLIMSFLARGPTREGTWYSFFLILA